MGVAKVFEEVRDLGWSDARKGERRQLIFGEELGIGSFVAVLWSAAGKFPDKEKFVRVEGVRGMAVKVAIENGGEFGDANFVARFFEDFASRGD